MLKKVDKKTVAILCISLVIVLAVAAGIGIAFGDKLGLENGAKADNETERVLCDFADSNGYSYNDNCLVSYGNGTTVFTYGNDNATVELTAFMGTNGNPNWNQVSVTCSSDKPDKLYATFKEVINDSLEAYKLARGDSNEDVANLTKEVQGAMKSCEKKANNVFAQSKASGQYDVNWEFTEGYIGAKYKSEIYYVGMVYTSDFTR